MLSIKVDESIKKRLVQIDLKLAEIYEDILGLELDEAEYLNHCALISNVGASTRIENAVLTDKEIEWLDSTLTNDGKTTAFELNKEAILNKLSKDKARSIEEVAGCRELLLHVYKSSESFYPLTQVNLRFLHHELLKHYPKAESYAGRYKQVTNRVVSRNQMTGEEKIVLEPAAPGVITEAAMTELVDWYNQAIRYEEGSLLVAIEFMFRFLAIHPFQDGNGRTGRAFYILSLLHSQNKYINRAVKYMAIDRHIEINRPMYYSALRRCSAGKFVTDPKLYDYIPIVHFMLNVFEDSIEGISLYRSKYKKLKSLNQNQMTIYECFKSFPEKKLKSSEIADATNMNHRTVQRELSKLSEGGFIHKRGDGASTIYQLIF